MAFVIKVSHANTLRRLTWRQDEVGESGVPFADLEARIRQALQIPAASGLSLTYLDTEGDFVTMSNDQDVNDALFQQKLNPLRVVVAVQPVEKAPSPAPTPLPASAPVPAAPATSPVAANDVTIKQVLSKLSNPEIKKLLQSYEPLFEKVSSPNQATAFLESVLSSVATQVASVVKHSTDVANAAAANPFGFVSGQSGGLSGSSPSSSTSSSPPPSMGAFTGIIPDVEQPRSEAAGKQKSDVDSVVHSGVSCDMCDMSPIVGLRYKSNKKFNYDLCSGCFEKHGKEEDFNKIEQSMFRPRHLQSHGMHRVVPSFHPLSHPGFHGRPFGMRGPPFGRHHSHGPAPGCIPCPGGKLDSRFVCDVTMFDGTEVSPNSQFTKIWRLRNNGGAPWPPRTNLVHVGGDELAPVSSVPLEIPPQGLPVEGEMEVAVDMVAPEKPGRYVSHWRLASPTGPKFGHRIWIVIQVVAPSDEVVPDAATDNSEAKSAPVVEEPAAEEIAESTDGNETAAEVVEELIADETVTSVVNVVVPADDAVTENVSDVQEKSVASDADLGEGYAMVDVESVRAEKEVEQAKLDNEKEMESDVEVAKADIVDDVKVEENAIGTPITYPKLDVKENLSEGPITYPQVEVAPLTTPESAESAESEVVAEGESLKTSLAKLQTMGFTNTKLNLELLEKNNLDLRQTLNDLCAAEEWDPILEELEEMGFYDVDVNRRLMFKNNGSVKRVVKELVQMYRNLQDK